MKQNAKNIFRCVIVVTLSLILTFSLTVSFLSLSLSALVRPAFYQSVAGEMNLAEEIRARLREDFAPLCQTSGVPEEVMGAFLSQDLTEEEMLWFAEGMFSDEDLSPKKAVWQEKMLLRVQRYAEEKRADGTFLLTDKEWEEMQASFPSLVDYFAEKVEDRLLQNGLYRTLGSLLQTGKRLGPYLLAVSFAITLFALLLILLIQKKKSLVALWATLASSGLLLLLPGAIYQIENYGIRLGIEPAFLRQFLHLTLTRLAQRLIVFGAILLVLGVLCGILAIVWHRKKAGKEERKGEAK